MKRSLQYGMISIMLIVGLLLCPLVPGIKLNLLANQWLRIVSDTPAQSQTTENSTSPEEATGSRSETSKTVTMNGTVTDKSQDQVTAKNSFIDGDVIFDPVPQIQLDSVEVLSRDGTSEPLAGELSGPTGTILKIKTSGFNPATVDGNVAIWTSSVNGQTLEVASLVLPDSQGSLQQTFSTVIPPLPPGVATLTLRNQNTGFTTEPLKVTITEPLPLSKPSTEIFGQFLTHTVAYLNDLPTSSAEETTAINDAIVHLTQAQTEFKQLVDGGLTPEEEQVLNDIALTIENSPIYNVQASQVGNDMIPAGYNSDATYEDFLGFLGAIAGIIGGIAAILTSTAGIAVFGGVLAIVVGILALPYYLCELFC